MLTFNKITTYAILTIIVSVLIFATANFNGFIEVDTGSYLDIAKHGFNSDSIRFRPILYPLFIKICFLITGENTFAGIVFFQLCSYILASLIFLYMLANDVNFSKININILALVVLLSVLSPNTIASNSSILPEILPLTFILLITYFTSLNINSFIKSITLGIILIIPALFKPLWLFLIILPLLNLALHFKLSGKYLYNIIIPIITAISIFSIHQTLIKKNIAKGHQFASTMDVNLNLAIIRCGITNGTEKTRLFKFLLKNKLSEKIKRRIWNNSKEEFEEFGSIKNSIPWEYREDKEYWQKALQNKDNLFKFAIVQLKRVRTFYTTSASSEAIKLLPNFINYIYQSFFHWLHKLVVFPIFILLTLRVLTKKEKGIIVIFWLVTLLASIILAILTYQDPHFSRMRIAVEPILLFLTFFGCWRIFKLLKLFSKRILVESQSKL